LLVCGRDEKIKRLHDGEGTFDVDKPTFPLYTRLADKRYVIQSVEFPRGKVPVAVAYVRTWFGKREVKDIAVQNMLAEQVLELAMER
jgi:hypothetical protein